MSDIGVLLNIDRCLGCFTCQTACRDTNGFDYDERWMEVVRRDPRPVDGKLRQYHLVAPNLDKCAECYMRDGEPKCESLCVAGALHVGPVESLLPLRERSNVVLYAPKG